jgi:Ca-activated chloride channel family protein
MWRSVGSGGLVVGLALSSAMLCPAAVGAADEPPTVIVVFDGSGSMWGNMEGTRASKLAVAREALQRGLARIGPQTRVGLASFGHRRAGCADVEVILPPEPLDAGRIMAPLERLNPRGRGPLTLALQEAAKALPSSPGRSSLLLIHDEPDNCQANLCEVAAELRSAGIAVSVVGLGLDQEAANKMLCLPQATGGRFYNPRTSDQVDAAIEAALRVASIGAEPVVPPAGQAPQPPPSASAPGFSSAPSVPPDAPAGLYLRALLAAKTDPVGWPLHWIVFPEGEPASVLYDAVAANPHVPVPPGRYVVEARDGAVSAQATFQVAEQGPTLANLVLEGGTLQVRGQAQKTGAPLGDAIITISAAGPGGDARKDTSGRMLAAFKGSEGIATLPAGRYVVRVEQGLVHTERSVVVPAGSRGRVDIALNAALLQLTATGRDGTPLKAPVFSVLEDDPDAPRGRREIARSASRQAQFLLPPGTYYVNVRQGGAEVLERVAVGPGDVVQRTLPLAAGRLSLSTRPIGGAQTHAAPVSYRVDRLDGPLPDALTTSQASPELYLAAGRYRVEARYGLANARLAREVDVKAGQAQQIEFEHQASTLKLRLTAVGGNPLAEVFWEVRDQAGRTVWTTGQPEPSVTLQAGRYRIRAETRDKRYERSVDVAGGEVRAFELTAD